ncbi:MAG: outer membrane beta-barrel protein [Bryobacterales bacterium]
MYAGVVSLLLLLLHTSTALAQSARRGQFEVRGLGGYSTFIDESSQNHVVAGGSGHYYITRRLSVGPEFLYMYRNEFDQDITASAHVAWDFKGSSRVQPYVAGRIGVLRHFAPRFAVNSWAYGAGLGVKIALTDRLFLTPEFSMGVEPILRATVGISYVVGHTRGAAGE